MIFGYLFKIKSFLRIFYLLKNTEKLFLRDIVFQESVFLFDMSYEEARF